MLTRIICILLCYGIVCAQDKPYFPLETGNVWQYKELFSPFIMEFSALGNVTAPNGVIYERVGRTSGGVENWYRQSAVAVFMYDSRGYDFPVFSFNDEVGDTSIFVHSPGDTFRSILEFKGNNNILGRDLRIWGYSVDFSTGSIDEETGYILVDSLGIWEWTNYLAGVPVTLQGAEINGIQYGTLTSVEPSMQVVESFSLAQNYPNPFNPTTTIRYSLAEATEVSLTVYDISGRKITELVQGRQASGEYEQQFDAAQLASGVYVYRLRAGDFVKARKMLLAR